MALFSSHPKRPGTSAGSPRAVPAAQGEGSPQRWKLTAEHLAGLAEVAVVLQRQLEGVQAQTGEAACVIVKRTSGIDAQLQALIGLLEQEAARLLDGSVKEGLRLRDEQGALEMLERFLERSTAHAEDAEERARRISEATASTVPVIKELRELAIQSKMLSINASVESARQGGAFGVIAEEVRNVSGRSSAAVALVEEAIARVAGLVGSQLSDVARQTQAQDAADREKLKRFAALVKRRTEEQRQLDDDQHRLLATVAQQHDLLREKVIELLAATQFEDVTRQRVEGVRYALAEMQGCLDNLATSMRSPEGLRELPAVLDAARLLQDYVMAQQREAHASALGEEKDLDEQPKIELF
jgi:methyl-accepting chemotaxis protein